MRSLLLAGVALTLTATSALAQAGARRAAPSTRAIAEMSLTFADTAAQRAAGKSALVRIDYGQPHLRGRKLLTDSLVPMGKVWRLGANAATLFTTDADLVIGGKDVAKGRYVAQLLPETTGWTLILQQETTGAAQVNVAAYDKAKDYARIPLKATTLMHGVESLSIVLVPSTAPGVQKGELTITWGTVHLAAEWSVK
jgi:predicted secreted protein